MAESSQGHQQMVYAFIIYACVQCLAEANPASTVAVSNATQFNTPSTLGVNQVSTTVVPEVCGDKLDTCSLYGRTPCSNKFYEAWSKYHCALYCGFCTPNISSLNQNECQDKVPNCPDFDDGNLCTEAAYHSWAYEHCQAYCKFGSCNHTCADIDGIDCSVLDSTINICSNTEKAKTICRHHCGLCDIAGDEYAELGDREEEEGFDMMRTVIIAVCSAGAYLALVIGLTAYCSYRLLLQRRNRKAIVKDEKQNGNLTQEQHELLMKDRDRDSGGTQCRSDSDNRSHVSALSSHPSHSSHSNSQTQSQNLSHQSTKSAGKSSLDRLYFPRQELQMIGMLGKCQYGDVYLAKARGVRAGEVESQVVVKALMSKEDHHYYEFQHEMEMYSRMDHNNVVRMIGVCRETDPLYYITEHCDWGDLKQFLLASRVDNNGRRLQRIPPLTVLQKIGMCNQVALGMEHLSNQRFVHRDLAARNVLLTSRLELKISHMSLSRDVYPSEYVIMNNQAALPLRWLSPEAALEGDYSTKSDVWAYGVFIWEVLHLGDLPHKNRTDEELLKGLKAGDVTLEISEHCPNEMLELVRNCTAESPKDRPSFTDICNVLADLVTVYSPPQFSPGVGMGLGLGQPGQLYPQVPAYPAMGTCST